MAAMGHMEDLSVKTAEFINDKGHLQEYMAEFHRWQEEIRAKLSDPMSNQSQ